jgi:hydrogenase expression/formation protein HypE
MSERITLAHGNGGRFMRELVEEAIAPALGAPGPDTSLDAAPLDGLSGVEASELVITTDGFTVQPLFFAGGDLGSLAVNGTVNDLAVAGATPRWLTLAMIIEEGTPVGTLSRLASSVGAAARSAEVRVVAGDTKVVPSGQGGGVYFTTTGVGVRRRADLGLSRIREGDRILVSGPVGDHGVAVMFAREQFDLKGEVRSDCAPVHRLCAALDGIDGVRFLRDPTRGGLATVAHEVAQARRCTVRVRETDIPVRPAVEGVCEILGYDPYYLACEGRVVAVVAPDAAERALSAWRMRPDGEDAQEIGRIEAARSELASPRVILETELGGERLLEELEDDPLPRIC